MSPNIDRPCSAKLWPNKLEGIMEISLGEYSRESRYVSHSRTFKALTGF